jgi:hypothetical protein
MRLSFLNNFFRSYAAYCGEDLAAYVCNDCPEAERELGRVRSVALIHKDYLATVMANPTDVTVWQTGIVSGMITIIPITAGSFDPGDPAQLKGYGDYKNSNGPREQTLSWFDPNYDQNYAFYNSLAKVRNRVVAYRTSSKIHIADKVATFNPKNAVEDDLETEVVWNVAAKFTSTELPSYHDAATLDTIFGCGNF